MHMILLWFVAAQATRTRPWCVLIGEAFLWHILSDVYCRGVDRIDEVRSIVLFDHFDARPAVLSDLVNVGALHETQTDVGVTQTVCRPRAAIPVFSEVSFILGVCRECAKAEALDAGQD